MAAKITSDTINKIARLANLKFTPDQLEGYTEKFASVVKYVEKLNSLDTKGIEPTAHATNGEGAVALKNTREDGVVKFSGTEEILDAAPKKSGRLVEVPKVIE
jgi:aspartyl-tRNA(Asn)/glutamyl-tRNA(Gln) amidotransferase subunit C